MALLRDFVLCRFEWIRKDLSSAQGSHLYRFRDASCSATPTAASSRPLRCSCAGPIVSASVRFCPSLFREAHSRPLPSASLHQSVRFYMFLRSDAHRHVLSSASLLSLARFARYLYREAHNSPLPSASLRQSARFSMPSGSDAYHSRPSSASLHLQAHFSLFPSSEAYPSVFLSASQAPGIFCLVLSRSLRLLGRGAKSVFNSEASLGIPGEASLLNIIIVRARGRLPEFFLADCGDEFFVVEWLEVCDVFEFSCAECRDGRGEHR